MLNLVSHPNANSMVPITEYQPLRADEGPYYENINRGSKSAYDYADTLNKIFSYSGSVLVTKPRTGDATAYSIYDIVGINDDTTITGIKADDITTTRVGMIVGIYQYTPGDTKHIVVGFSPILDLPEFKVIPGTLGQQLYLDANTKWLTTNPGTAGTVFSYAIARKTGPNSIFWFGIGTTGPEVHKHTTADITDFSAAIDMTWDKVKNKPLTFPALAHAASHGAGGSDVIKLDELAAPTDVDTLNATAQAHGLMPRLSGDAQDTMCGDGQWRKPGVVSVPEVTTTAAGLLPKLPGSASKIFNGAGAWVDLPSAPVPASGDDNEDFNTDGPFNRFGWSSVGTFPFPANALTCSDGWLFMNNQYQTQGEADVNVNGIWKTCPTGDFVAYSKALYDMSARSRGMYSVGGLAVILPKDSDPASRMYGTFGGYMSTYFASGGGSVADGGITGLYVGKNYTPSNPTTLVSTMTWPDYYLPDNALYVSGVVFQRIRRKNGQLTLSLSVDGRYWRVVGDLGAVVPSHLGLMSFGGTHVDFFKRFDNPDTKLFAY